MTQPSECSLTVKRRGKLVRVSPHQNKKEEWELDVLAHVQGVTHSGFPLEATLPSFRHVQVLKITTLGIRSIPDDIKNLENVTSLWLINGDLEGFPLAVCQLNKLTELGLRGNEKIKEIPPEACGKMKRLRSLYMRKCGLTCLPESLDQLVDLEVLSLGDNSLTHLCKGLKSITKLTTVRLYNNPFECLEEEFPFDTLINIQELWL